MGEHPDPNPAPRKDWFLIAKVLKWWKASGVQFRRDFVSRLVCALSLTADVEAFYLGSYRSTLFTNDRANLPEARRDLAS
jgi:hypothetical protein